MASSSAEQSKFSSLFSSAFQRKTKKKETEDDRSEKRKKQKLDYESSRKRGIVPGWKTEFPWLGTDENDETKFASVSEIDLEIY